MVLICPTCLVHSLLLVQSTALNPWSADLINLLFVLLYLSVCLSSTVAVCLCCQCTSCVLPNMCSWVVACFGVYLSGLGDAALFWSSLVRFCYRRMIRQVIKIILWHSVAKCTCIELINILRDSFCFMLAPLKTLPIENAGCAFWSLYITTACLPAHLHTQWSIGFHIFYLDYFVLVMNSCLFPSIQRFHDYYSGFSLLFTFSWLLYAHAFGFICKQSAIPALVS